MTTVDPELWRQIDDLFQSALQLSPDQREAFVKKSCSGNAELEGEVRSLLGAREKAAHFLGTPAMEVVAMKVARGRRDVGGQSVDAVIGMQVSHYVVLARLGGGGMGVVYKAEDTRLKRLVAVKFLTEEFDRDPAILQRFRREARAASALNHPNICAVYDIGEHDGRAFIVMELLDGSTLRECVPLKMRAAIALGIEIAEGLEAAHAAGVVHRDIKPANIMITARGHAKILDFGLAHTGRLEANEDPVTHPGMAIGTAGYMSPEQESGRVLDARTDIYSLGLVLYEMVNGHRPLPGAALSAGLPRGFAAVVSRCLQPDVEKRYQRAAEIVGDLEKLRRTSGEGRRTRRRVLTGAALVFLVLMAGYVITWRAAHPGRKLTDRDTIVLADFENSTGDPVFDETLREGLAIQLAQSPFLSVIRESRIQQVLPMMRQPPKVQLTPAIAREVCERTASAAVLEGWIRSIGSEYVVGLRARNCATGNVLDEEQAPAVRKEEVLVVLSHLAAAFRARVGESDLTLQQHRTPLPEATTISLDALKQFSAGLRLYHAGDDKAALTRFENAVAIDPNFAMAHAWAARMYGNREDPVRSAESARKAYQLREHTSDREKFYIAAQYELQVTGNLEKAREICEDWSRAYPRDPPAGFLGLIYTVMGRYDKALESTTALLDLTPDSGSAYAFVGGAYLNLGRLADAEETLRRAAQRKLDVVDSHVLGYRIAFLRNDTVGMEREVALAQGSSYAEAWMALQEVFALAYRGRLTAARRMSNHAAELSFLAGQPEKAALYRTPIPVIEALYGQAAEAKAGAKRVLDLSSGLYVLYGAAFALAEARDSAGAERRILEIEERFGEDVGAVFSYVPVLRARVALNRGEHEKALEHLQIAAAYELGTPRSTIHGNFGALYPVYLRGETYLSMGRGREAAGEFQKILDHPGVVVSDPVGAVARLQLGRAMALAGDREKAQSAYRDFLNLWKDADAGIPVFEQAKKELSELIASDRSATVRR